MRTSGRADLMEKSDQRQKAFYSFERILEQINSIEMLFIDQR